MAQHWLEIEVELVGGLGEFVWPRPGRVFLARGDGTFRQLAEAINHGFARWELGHLHQFVLPGGDEVVPVDLWDEDDDDALDDATTRLSVLAPGEPFAYVFDLGDGWEHLCTVTDAAVDPMELWGEEPEEAIVCTFGWGDLPDQHGRQWRDDDGQSPPPPPPDVLTEDLPPLLPHWSDRLRVVPDHDAPAWLGPMPEWDLGTYGELRGAVNRGDGAAIVDLLRHRDVLEVAQLAGDGLLVAIDKGIEEAADMARSLAADVRERFHIGDEDLADQLDAACGVGETPSLAAAPVALDDLSMHLESGDDLLGTWMVNVETGEWLPDDPMGIAGIPEPDDWEDPDRWLAVTSLGSREAWKDMRSFIDRLDDGDLADRLYRAIDGRGAFRMFRTVLHDHPELVEAWRRFSEERQRGRARAWLATSGYRPVNRSNG